MRFLTRRRLLIAVPLVVLLAVVTFVLFFPGEDLKARSARITEGMAQEQVEGLLGKPVLVMHRPAGKGGALTWTDQLWQVTVFTDPEGRAEFMVCIPSDSFYRRTVGKVLALPK